MRKISSYEKRETESKKIATRIGKILFDGTLTNTNTLKELNQNGLSILDFKLGNNSIKSIKNKLSELKMQDAYPSRNNYKKFYFENIPNDSNVAEYFLSDLSQIKEIIDLFNDPIILKIVQEYLGCKPIISDINAWWTKHNRNKARDAQLFHRDVLDYRFVKLFCYLTDVPDIKYGPTYYVKGSHKSNYNVGNHGRVSDASVFQEFGSKNICSVFGKKGTLFLADTFGIHKGSMPKIEDRLVMQCVYSINPIGSNTYEKTKKIKGTNYDIYINKLLYK